MEVGRGTSVKVTEALHACLVYFFSNRKEWTFSRNGCQKTGGAAHTGLVERCWFKEKDDERQQGSLSRVTGHVTRHTILS